MVSLGEMGATDEGNEETLLTSITPLLDQSTQLPDQELAAALPPMTLF